MAKRLAIDPSVLKGAVYPATVRDNSQNLFSSSYFVESGVAVSELPVAERQLHSYAAAYRENKLER